MNEFPYDLTNSSNPWLINTNKNQLLIDDSGNKLSAEYIWSKQGKDREDLVQWVFDYYRKNGFPYPKLSNNELLKSFEKLKNAKSAYDEKNNLLNNSGNHGLDIIKHFCGENFYNAKAEKSRSVLEVFNDDELLMKVLKNRMGWCKTSEDGTERPFIFGMGPKMLIQGIRSSGLSKNVSQFKVSVAQALYKMLCPENGTVLDYSAGWGSRLLGAISLGHSYYGIDPLTADDLNKALNFFKGNGSIIKNGSENIESYKNIPMADFALSCPPYYDQENFSNDISQSCIKYPQYQDWLNNYWKQTVENCIQKLKPNGHFCLVIIDVFNKLNLREDMTKICVDAGLTHIKNIEIKTAKSHLSGKKQSKQLMKNTEKAVIMKLS